MDISHSRIGYILEEDICLVDSATTHTILKMKNTSLICKNVVVMLIQFLEVQI